MNDRITKRERGLLKGAMRRVFSRSDLRRKVLDSVDVVHTDPNRPRVKKWSRCPVCTNLTPKYLMIVDHIDPVIPVNTSFENMSMDEVLDRMWCVIINLQPICATCHDSKTKVEREQRKINKRRNKKL